MCGEARQGTQGDETRVSLGSGRNFQADVRPRKGDHCTGKARSSWSSVRKCGRIISLIVAGTRAPVRSRSTGMIVTEGQSQGRRNLEDENDMLRHEKKRAFSFTAFRESSTNPYLYVLSYVTYSGNPCAIYKAWATPLFRGFRGCALNNLESLEVQQDHL